MLSINFKEIHLSYDLQISLLDELRSEIANLTSYVGFLCGHYPPTSLAIYFKSYHYRSCNSA